MALGRQLAVYCLDVAVITVSSLVCLTSIGVVAYGSDRGVGAPARMVRLSDSFPDGVWSLGTSITRSQTPYWERDRILGLLYM